MFDNLIESKAKKQRRAGGVVASAVIHTVLITAAVYGTLHAIACSVPYTAAVMSTVWITALATTPPARLCFFAFDSIRLSNMSLGLIGGSKKKTGGNYSGLNLFFAS